MDNHDKAFYHTKLIFNNIHKYPDITIESLLFNPNSENILLEMHLTYLNRRIRVYLTDTKEGAYWYVYPFKNTYLCLKEKEFEDYVLLFNAVYETLNEAH